MPDGSVLWTNVTLNFILFWVFAMSLCCCVQSICCRFAV